MMLAVLLTGLVQIGPPDTSTAVFETMLETLHEVEQDAESVLESLEDAARWKVPLNTASIEALRGLPGMSEADVQLLVSYRSASGRFDGPDDLLAAGLSEDVAASLLPFISYDAPSARPPLEVDVVQRWSRRLDVGRGFGTEGPSGYLGSPHALQSRVRARLGRRVFAGLTLDKDAGEPAVSSLPRLGADFVSAHLGVDDVGPLERVVVGSYSVHAGGGLVLGHGTSNMSALRVDAGDRLLRPHTSTREHGYLRGMAVQLRPVRGAGVAIFAASQALDGRRDSLAGGWRLAAPGLHRTATELDGRRLIGARTLGGIATLRLQSVHAGALLVYSRFELDGVQRTVSSSSLFGGWIRSRSALTVELVPSFGHAAATASFSPSGGARLAVRGRRTRARGFRPHAGTGVDSRGESVLLREWEASIAFRPLESWSVDGRVRERKRGHDVLGLSTTRQGQLVVEYRPSRWYALQVRATARSSDAAVSCTADLRLLRCHGRDVRRSVRVQLDYEHSAALRSRSRVELARSDPASAEASPGDGFLIYEDLRWRPKRWMQLDIRYGLFETTDASTRIVALENDLLYAFAAPSFSGRGRRWYVLVRADPSARLSFQLKLGATIYEDAISVGSGLDEVLGDRIREMKLQMRWKIGM